MLWKGMEVLLEVKLEQKLCGKENFDTKWRTTVHNWLKVKLLFYSSIKLAFQFFLQLSDMCFSSWDINIFVTSIFRIWGYFRWSNVWYIRNKTCMKRKSQTTKLFQLEWPFFWQLKISHKPENHLSQLPHDILTR